MTQEKPISDRVEQEADELLSGFFTRFRSSYKKMNLPDSTALYHYTSLEGLLGILENRSLRCSAIQFQNDTSELRHGLAIANQIFDRETATARLSAQKEYLERMKQDLQAFILNSNLFTFSLSLKGDLLSQWRGYTPEAAGVSIGFNKKLVARAVNPYGRLWPAIYDDNAKHDLLNEIVTSLIQITAGVGDDAIDQKLFLPILARLMGAMTFTIAAFKDASFGEEHEWRLIIDLDARSSKSLSVCHRVRRDVVVPFVDVPLPKPEDASQTLPHEVIVSPSDRDGMTEASVKRYLKDVGYGETTITRSVIPYRTNR